LQIKSHVCAARLFPALRHLITLARLYGVSVDSLVNEETDCRARNTIVVPAADEVITFLCRAKRSTYAGNGAVIAPSRQSSHDLYYAEGDLAYYDTYLGSEAFTGEEGLWKDAVPFWALNYVGRILDESFSGDFLKAALSHVGPDMPYRGPRIYSEHDKVYHCDVDGSFDWFYGKEEILHGRTKVYERRFHGGLIH
jgi:Domain of unknown function (DUF5680)